MFFIVTDKNQEGITQMFNSISNNLDDTIIIGNSIRLVEHVRHRNIIPCCEKDRVVEIGYCNKLDAWYGKNLKKI